MDVKKEPEEPKIHFSKLSIKAQQCCVLLRSFGAEFVDQELTKTLIKQEFRRMAKKLHPDLNGENSELKKQEFALQFHKMNEAYNVLKLEVDEALLPPPM